LLTTLLLVHLALAADPAPTAAGEATPPAPPPPKEEKKFPDLQMSGLLFAHYLYMLPEAADGYNEFGIDRAYLIAKSKLSPHMATRLTLDADRAKVPVDSTGAPVTGYDTKYRVFVKHAYLEGSWTKYGLKARGGIIDTPFAPYYDSFAGIRYIMKSFTDQNKLLDTADAGVGLYGTHANGLIDWNASLLNGEGYSNLEVDKGKMVNGRFTVDPLASGKKMNLPISVYGSMNGKPAVGDPIVALIGAVGFKQEYIAAWAEYDMFSQGDLKYGGYSLTLHPMAPDVGGVIFRYDNFDPNSDADDDALTTMVVGLTHDFKPNQVSIAGTFEQVSLQNANDPISQTIFVHMQAGF
jgi:hypothetical protein